MPPQWPECQKARGRRWPLGGSGTGTRGAGASSAGGPRARPPARREAEARAAVDTQPHWAGWVAALGTGPTYCWGRAAAAPGEWGPGPQRAGRALLCHAGGRPQDTHGHVVCRRSYGRRVNWPPTVVHAAGGGGTNLGRGAAGSHRGRKGWTSPATRSSQPHEDLTGAHLWKWPRGQRKRSRV